MLLAVNYHGYAFELLPNKFKCDLDFIEKCVKKHPYILRFLKPKIRLNYLFLEKLMKLNGYCLQYIPEVFDDFDLAMLAVKQNGLAINFLEGNLKKIKILLLRL